MKILAVSDRVEPMLYDHFNRDNFPGIDLILSCGDLPSEYLTFLVTVFNVPLYYVKGNHDAHYSMRPPQGCVDLHARIVSYRGVRLAGLEGCRWYNGGPLQYTEPRMRQILGKLKWRLFWSRGLDIVIAHAPPRFLNDAEDPCHKGFKCYLHLIERYSPKYFLHGHIHARFEKDTERTATVGNTKVINTFGYCLLDMDRDEIL